MSQEDVLTQLSKQLLDDRKAERRRTYLKYAIFGTLGLLYGTAFLVAQLSRNADAQLPDKYVNVVRISGTIAPGESASAEALNPLLAKAFSDPKAEGVVLLVNSPGGTPVQSSLIHDMILRQKEKHNKTVVAVGEDMVTSGAYFIAAAADEIVVNRSTVTGSIGVISRSFGFTGLMDRLGVERRVMTAGDSKNLGDPFGPQSEAGVAKQEELLGQIHQHFIEAVKAGRGDRLNLSTPGLFSGSVWTGDAAVSIGLVDGLGDLPSTAERVFGTTALREIKPARSLPELLLSGIGVEATKLVRVWAQQPPAVLVP